MLCIVVMPAKAGIQWRSHRKKAEFRSLPRAGYFPFGESSQSHSRWTRWSRRHRVGSTALAPCLARAGANSRILALEQSRLARALGIVASASRTVQESSLTDGHPWPAYSI